MLQLHCSFALFVIKIKPHAFFKNKKIKLKERKQRLNHFFFLSDSSGLKYCSQLDREDAATSGASSAVPRPLLGVNRNIYTQAQQGLLSEDDFYDGIRNPYVLVINNVNFIKPSPWPRNGASHDRDNIRSFVKEAGFKTVVERFDLSKENMLHVFEQTRRNGALGK